MMLRVKDFAEEMNVHPNQIYRLVSANRTPDDRMPHYQVGGTVRIDRDEAMAWMRARAMEAKS